MSVFFCLALSCEGTGLVIPRSRSPTKMSKWFHSFEVNYEPEQARGT
jgi:hypothetical protein